MPQLKPVYTTLVLPSTRATLPFWASVLGGIWTLRLTSQNLNDGGPRPHHPRQTNWLPEGSRGYTIWDYPLETFQCSPNHTLHQGRAAHASKSSKFLTFACVSRVRLPPNFLQPLGTLWAERA